MPDLFKLLFEDHPDPDDDVRRLLEAAEKVEQLEVKQVPLEQALKALGLEGEVEVTPDGAKLIFADDAAYHKAVALLGTPDTVAQLCGAGWVPFVDGDQRPGDEAPRYVVSFLQLDDPTADGSEANSPTAPSTEELALDAAKFNGFANQGAKVVPVPVAKGKEPKKLDGGDTKYTPKTESLTEDVVGDIMAYEDGSMSEEDTIKFFQRLIDSGMAWSLQGSYGRTAMDLINQGLCHRRQGHGNAPERFPAKPQAESARGRIDKVFEDDIYSQCVENYINGNLKDARRQAVRIPFARLAHELRERGYDDHAVSAIAHYLKGTGTWQAACDADQKLARTKFNAPGSPHAPRRKGPDVVGELAD
jgi:hypothetical protein